MTARLFHSTRRKPLTTGDPSPTDVPAMPRVRITRKFAQLIDGIDLSRVKAGDMLDLSEKDVRVLLAGCCLSRQGVAFAGPLPPEIQSHLTFTAGVSMNARAPEAAKQLIRISHRVGRQSRDAKARHGARFPIGGLKSA